MKKRNKMKRGFTLIELITVVIIIAIMSALALPQYTRFIERSQASTARNALDMIRKSQAIYFALNSQYADALDNLTTDTPEIAKLPLNTEWNFTTICQTGCDDFSSVARRINGVYSGATMTQLSNATTTYTLSTSGKDPSKIW